MLQKIWMSQGDGVGMYGLLQVRLPHIVSYKNIKTKIYIGFVQLAYVYIKLVMFKGWLHSPMRLACRKVAFNKEER